MTEAQFRKVALSFEGVSEAPHFHRTSFRVGTKIFATMTRDGREAMVRVRPAEKLEALLRGFPDVFFPYGGWTDRYGSLGIRLPAAPGRLVADLLRDAFVELEPRRPRAPPSAPRRKPSRPTHRLRVRARD